MGATLDPTLLTALVGGGVSLVVAIAHLTGHTTTATIDDEAQARALYAVDAPDAQITAVAVSPERTAAVLARADGRLGVLFSHGDAWVTRTVTRAAVRGNFVQVGTGDLGVSTRQIPLPADWSAG